MLSVPPQWLRDVITLQCSIMRHLSCRRGMSSRWDSEAGEKADVKPCVAPPGESVSLCSSDRTAPSAGPPVVCNTLPEPQGAPTVCSTLPSPQGALEGRAACGLCSGRVCQGCPTANGPTEPTARANGPLPCAPPAQSCKQGAALLRVSGPPRPRPPTPPTSAPRPINHAGGPPIKTENSSTHGPCGLKGPPSPVPNACAHPDLALPLPGSAGGQAAALSSRSVSSPPAGTRALTPPRAPPDPAAAWLASPTPPSGTTRPQTLPQASSGLTQINRSLKLLVFEFINHVHVVVLMHCRPT